jgi:hypothetical protein
VCFCFNLRSCCAAQINGSSKGKSRSGIVHPFISFPFSLNSEAKMVAQQKFRVHFRSGFTFRTDRLLGNAYQNEIQNEPGVPSFLRFSAQIEARVRTPATRPPLSPALAPAHADVRSNSQRSASPSPINWARQRPNGSAENGNNAPAPYLCDGSHIRWLSPTCSLRLSPLTNAHRSMHARPHHVARSRLLALLRILRSATTGARRDPSSAGCRTISDLLLCRCCAATSPSKADWGLQPLTGGQQLEAPRRICE